MNGTKYTNKDIKDLIKLYPLGKKEDILNRFPSICWRTIQNIAYSLNLKRKINEKRNGKIEKLFNKSFESFYWIGLISTDGYVSKDGELKVDLCKTDYLYLKKLANFLETKLYFFPKYKGGKSGAKGICRVKIKDIHYGVKLREHLNIKGKKTYNPISINFISTKKQLISFFCGMVDGDGTINKLSEGISIDMHKNYKNFFVTIGNKLKRYGLVDKYYISEYKKMCRLMISKESSKKIKKEALKLNLPLMERKWDIINHLKTTRKINYRKYIEWINKQDVFCVKDMFDYFKIKRRIKNRHIGESRITEIISHAKKQSCIQHLGRFGWDVAYIVINEVPLDLIKSYNR